MSKPIVAYQGEPGAFSHLACRQARPEHEPAPRPTFDDALRAVETGEADLAMIPVENSVAGRVADIHHLLPGSSLHIIAEHFQPVRLSLMAAPGVGLDDVRRVRSHPMALAQSRDFLRAQGLTAAPDFDTAGAARHLAETQSRDEAALASSLAAEIYGLNILAADVHDDPDNTTRFVIMAREPLAPPVEAAAMTSFLFRVRNVPAALYKALGGFATNGVNMTKLESYQIGGGFVASQFYADVEGRPDDPALARAFEELKFFTSTFRIVGVYAAHPFRKDRNPPA